MVISCHQVDQVWLVNVTYHLGDDKHISIATNMEYATHFDAARETAEGLEMLGYEISDDVLCFDENGDSLATYRFSAEHRKGLI